jgi:hypothetical protein
VRWLACSLIAALGCSAGDDEPWKVRVDTVLARATSESVPEPRVRAALAKAWQRTPMFAPATRGEDEEGSLEADLGYWEVVDDDGARQLVVSIQVETPEPLRTRPSATEHIEATVLLERDGAESLEQDLNLALARAVIVIDARTRLVHGSAEQLQVLLGGDDPDLAALALEWVRDGGQTRHLQDVLRLLDHPDERVFLAAVEALGAVGGPQHAATLIERVQLQDPAHAQRTYEALAALGGPDAVGFLRFAAQNEDDPARRRAARSALRSADGRASVEARRDPEIGHRR